LVDLQLYLLVSKLKGLAILFQIYELQVFALFGVIYSRD